MMAEDFIVIRVEFEREIPPRSFEATLAAAGISESVVVDPCQYCGDGAAEADLESLVAAWSAGRRLTADTRGLVLAYCGGMAFGEEVLAHLHPSSTLLVADPVAFGPDTWREVGNELMTGRVTPGGADCSFADLAKLLEADLEAACGDLPAFLREEILRGQLLWTDYVRLAGASTQRSYGAGVVELYAGRDQDQAEAEEADVVLTEGDPITSPEMSDRCAEIVASWSKGAA